MSSVSFHYSLNNKLYHKPLDLCNEIYYWYKRNWLYNRDSKSKCQTLLVLHWYMYDKSKFNYRTISTFNTFNVFINIIIIKNNSRVFVIFIQIMCFVIIPRTGPRPASSIPKITFSVFVVSGNSDSMYTSNELFSFEITDFTSEMVRQTL